MSQNPSEKPHVSVNVPPHLYVLHGHMAGHFDGKPDHYYDVDRMVSHPIGRCSLHIQIKTKLN